MGRMGTPSAWETIPSPRAANAGTSGTTAPPTTPVEFDDGAFVVGPVVAPLVTPVAAFRPRSLPWPPARPILGAGGFYGRTYLVGQGNLHFETSPRMDDW